MSPPDDVEIKEIAKCLAKDSMWYFCFVDGDPEEARREGYQKYLETVEQALRYAKNG